MSTTPRTEQVLDFDEIGRPLSLAVHGQELIPMEEFGAPLHIERTTELHWSTKDRAYYIQLLTGKLAGEVVSYELMALYGIRSNIFIFIADVMIHPENPIVPIPCWATRDRAIAAEISLVETLRAVDPELV